MSGTGSGLTPTTTDSRGDRRTSPGVLAPLSRSCSFWRSPGAARVPSGFAAELGDKEADLATVSPGLQGWASKEWRGNRGNDCPGFRWAK